MFLWSSLKLSLTVETRTPSTDGRLSEVLSRLIDESGIFAGTVRQPLLERKSYTAAVRLTVTARLMSQDPSSDGHAALI